jgi:hypothetical protein
LFSLLHFVEYFGEGFTGFAILLIIPAVILFLDRDRNPERKSYLSTHLENHFFDSVTKLATRATRRDSE